MKNREYKKILVPYDVWRNRISPVVLWAFPAYCPVSTQLSEGWEL